MTSLKITPSTTKTGLMPSVSHPPGVFCDKNAPCWKLGVCYDIPLCDVRWNMYKAYAYNASVYLQDPVGFFNYLDWYFKVITAFRWHVSGDIPDPWYFENMCRLHEENPHVRGIVFTKKYDIVNGFLNSGGIIPDNLTVIFSAWAGFPMPNPYDLPISRVIEKGSGFSNLCPENLDKDWTCQDCLMEHKGCFSLRHGEEIQFYRHGVGSQGHRRALERKLKASGF